jgi:squalene synthase HpnC
MEEMEGLPVSLASRDARRYCARLARGHYENFTVVSWFLPRSLRQHFYNVYAYCRWADDLADETGDPARALELLDEWERELDACYAGRPGHPVFVALAETIREFELPSEPFRHLLRAFRQDQRVTRYETYADLLEYCRYSANPVGRLVLMLCGYRDEERMRLSDCICTGLQLANFWQDVTVDLGKGRIYLPREDQDRFGVTEEQITRQLFTPEFAALMRFQVERTRDLFARGAPLIEMVDHRVRRDIRLFARGGEEVLRLIECQGYDVLTRRPSLSRARKAALIAGALLEGIGSGATK